MTDQLDRRGFLKTTGAALAAGAAASGTDPQNAALAQDAASPDGPDMDAGRYIYKSLKYGMIGGKESMTDKLKLIKDLGYDGVEMGSPTLNVKEVVAAVEAAELPVDGLVNSPHWQVRLSDPKAETRKQALENLKIALRDCHAVGGHTVLLVTGHGKDGTPSQVWDRCTEQIKQALPLAAKLGVWIAFENVWNQFLYDHGGGGDQTAEQYAAFVDQFDCPWVGMQFDIGNHVKYGPPAQWIRTLGQRIVKLDVKDFKIGGGFCKIGDGSADWPEVRKALKEINFHGWGAAEVGGGGRDRLAEILSNMNKTLGVAEKVS